MDTLLDLATPALKSLSRQEQLSAQLALHIERYILYPPFVQRVNDLPQLQWHSIDFDMAHRDKLPRSKGVYAFAIEFNDSRLPKTSHITYIGKAGDDNSNNTIWNRFYDYVRHRNIGDRPRISEMLTRWEGHLRYYYAVVPAGFSTGDVEEHLIDILMPPYNRGDYSPELQSLLKGANIL
jgi:hypothetical protein